MKGFELAIIWWRGKDATTTESLCPLYIFHNHRHLRFVDTSSYVASCHSRHKAHFGTVCGASVLICPQIQCQVAGLPTTAMSGQFLLDVYGHNYIWRKWAIPGLFMRYFRPFKTIPADVTNKRENIWRLDLNRRPVDFDSPPLATRPLPLEGGKEPNRGTRYETVWPDKNRQMSIKVTQKWFHQENEWFWHLFKNCLTMWAIWV